MSDRNIDKEPNPVSVTIASNDLNFEESEIKCSTSDESLTPSICMELQQKFLKNPDIGPYTDGFKNPSIKKRLKPFDLKWCYGLTPENGVKNFGKKMFYTALNVGCLYDLESHEMDFLQAHENTIISVTTDYSRQFIATAAKGTENICAIIWDINEKLPIFTIFSLYPNSDNICLRLPMKAKYLVTLGLDGKRYSLDVWSWTLGKDTPDDSFYIDADYGQPIDICCPHVEDSLMVIFEKAVLFFEWNEDICKMKLLNKIPNNNYNKIGIYTGGIYGKYSHNSFTITYKGYVCIFGNKLHFEEYQIGDKFNNNKIFIRSVLISENAIITCIKSVDKLIVLGKSDGGIYFYNHQMILMYWFGSFNLGPITSISFFYTEIDDKLNLKNPPLDASVNPQPFIINKFLVSTAEGNVYKIDPLKQTCRAVFDILECNITIIETHSNKPYLLIAFTNGRISLYNFETNKQILSINLYEFVEQKTTMEISCLKYCPNSFHLVCGTTTGLIFILDPILLKPKCAPFRHGEHNIKKIVFSLNSCEFAYYDSTNMVYLFRYNSNENEWQLKAFTKAHYKPITDILFYSNSQNNESILCTIGADRYLTEYKTSENSEKLEEKSDTRIEQTAIPMKIVYFEKNLNEKSFGYFLTIDNQHKFKVLSVETKMTRGVYLGPAFGCFENQQIHQMRILKNNQYMVFATEKYIGLHVLPIDGNPYKYVGFLGHASGMGDFAISYDDNYLFTYGKNDRCVFKWKIKEKSVDFMEQLGGKELAPFYCLIEGGQNGWLFHEMMDLFYYIQLLEQANSVTQIRKIGDFISISELPDLMRACGFYPTEYEIENFVTDIQYRDFDAQGTTRDKISFTEFVRLFINHKPVNGTSLEQYANAFDFVTNFKTHLLQTNKLERLTILLSHLGEPMNEENINACLQILTKDSDTDIETIAKESFTGEEFVNNFLGFKSDDDDDDE